MIFTDAQNYCYQHNIQFDNEMLYDEHKVDCDDLLSIENLCTQHLVNGAMCGEHFGNTTSLLEHIRQAHYVFVCLECDYQCTDRRQLSYHDHITTLNKRSIYSCKYNYPL